MRKIYGRPFAILIRVALATWLMLVGQAEIVLAQQPKRIGVLVVTILPKEMDALRQGLRDAGYIEGRTIVFDWRLAKGETSRAPSLATELVNSKPDVIVVDSTPATKAAMAATSTIPIVMAVPGDPVGSGLVESLGHPGHNVTGLSLMAPEVSIKQLELLKEVVPTLKRVGVMWDSSIGWHTKTLERLRALAASSGLTLAEARAQRVPDFEGAFSALREAHVEAICVLDSAFYIEERKTLLGFAARSKVPIMFREGHFVREGGLISYSADSVDLFRRAARYVDQVLKGASPADLPVEQPIKFELLVNLKTANALHLRVPQHILQRADEVLR